MSNRRFRLFRPGFSRAWLTRVAAAAAILVFVVGTVVASPGLHLRRRIRGLTARVSEQVDVPGVRDCWGLFSHRRECERR